MTPGYFTGIVTTEHAGNFQDPVFTLEIVHTCCRTTFSYFFLYVILVIGCARDKDIVCYRNNLVLSAQIYHFFSYFLDSFTSNTAVNFIKN